MEHLHLYIIFNAKPGCREAFLREFEESGVAAKIRAEQGCVCFDFYSSAQDDTTLLLIEDWESEAEQQVHLKQPHMADFRVIREKYIEGFSLKKMKFE